VATLDDVPFLQQPIGQMRPVGYDELGNPVYQNALTGAQYMLDYSQTGPREPRGNALSRIGGYVRNALGGMVEGTVNAVTAPGRAATGQPMTYGDVMDTAGFAQLGGAAMAAPANALRSGAMRTMTPAQEVAEMLRTGRAADVTDEMMARVDPQEMFRLYESGATGIDMPMDAASRAARAEGMGFDTGTPLYHGTGADFQAFAANPNHRFSAGSGGPQERAAWLTEGTGDAARYAGSELTMDTGAGFPSVIPARIRPGQQEIIDDRYGVGDAIRRGADSVNVRQDLYSELSGELQHWRVVPNPRNIRSTFARFDPRLAHLSNLNAANASPLVGGATLSAQERDELEAYLARR
jgi:hypothetical protein